MITKGEGCVLRWKQRKIRKERNRRHIKMGIKQFVFPYWDASLEQSSHC